MVDNAVHAPLAQQVRLELSFLCPESHVHTSLLHLPLLLQGGLDRLAEAAGTVDELSQQAEAQRTLLAAKQGEADAALGNIQVKYCWIVIQACDHCTSLPLRGALNRCQAGEYQQIGQQVLEAWLHLWLAGNGCTAVICCVVQSSMEVAADRRREVEQLRQQLGETEAALQQRRGAQACMC
jgi:hypothetical protein